jgi:predicted  nucleic acid-binding Zn-ribbon protein
MNESNLGLMRCTACGGLIGSSGQEVTRLVCTKCGQNYNLVMSLQPIPPKEETQKLLPG